MTTDRKHALTYAFDSTWRPLLKDLGISISNVLRKAGIPESILTYPSARLSAVDFHRFWESLESELNDPMLPLLFCSKISSETFSPLLFAALCSPNLGVAVQRIARYKTLIAPMRLSMWQQDHCVVIDLAWMDITQQPPVSLVITELLFFITLARMGTRERITPLRLTTTIIPPLNEAYTAFLGVTIEQGESHQLVFRKEDTLLPFLTLNAGFWTAFEPELRTQLAELGTVNVAQRVRSALLEALPSGLADVESVSRKLATSKRSLQRQLALEGLSFKQLLQETRRSLALHYLQKTELSVTEISFLLGFEEVNSFYRAFRMWMGQTPDEFRKQ